jgi:hypothetical protein
VARQLTADRNRVRVAFRQHGIGRGAGGCLRPHVVERHAPILWAVDVALGREARIEA